MLGYTEAAWDGALVPPGCCNSAWEADQTAVRSWEELTQPQRAAAAALGYDREAWDSEMRDSEPPPDSGAEAKFATGEEVLAYDSSGKCLDAKVLDARRSNDTRDGGGREYFVHYKGWSAKWCAAPPQPLNNATR